MSLRDKANDVKAILMRKRLAAAAMVMALLLTGCGQGVGPGGGQYGTENVRLPDGRTVICVIHSGGGVDCDWNDAR